MAYPEKISSVTCFAKRLQSLGSNFSEKALKRASQCAGVFDCMLDRIDKDLSIAKESGSHKNKLAIIKELLQAGVFTLSSFTSIKCNVVSSLMYNDNFHKWIKKELKIIK